MSETPEAPGTPEETSAWLESLSPDAVQRLAQSMASDLRRALEPDVEDPFDYGHEPIDLPEPPSQPVLLTVRVSLDDTQPEVWRRLTIPGEFDLGKVHDALQQAMGWTDSHLHQFALGEPYVSPHFLTSYDIEEGDEGTLETDARLDQILHEPGDRLTYEYDFGDGWTHTVLLESVEPPPNPLPNPQSGRTTSGAGGTTTADSAAYPLLCVAGECACPPEDVGGVGGYEEVAAWVRAGQDDGHTLDNGLTGAEMRAWLPDGWDPDHFDLDEVNAALARLAPRDTAAALAQLPGEIVEVISRLHTAARFEVDDWLSAPGWGEPVVFTDEEAAALTTPYRVMLEAVGDGLTLTAAGYLPPRVVETVFRDAWLTDEWIGKGNREDLTLPVLHLRESTRRYGLLRKAKGRLLPTARGKALREDPRALLDLVLTRLAIDGDDFEHLASGLTLLGLAGGAPLGGRRWSGVEAMDLADDVCRVLTIAGWRTSDGGPIEPHDVVGATHDTVRSVRQMVRCVDAPDAAQGMLDADVGRRLARAILQRMS